MGNQQTLTKHSFSDIQQPIRDIYSDSKLIQILDPSTFIGEKFKKFSENFYLMSKIGAFLSFSPREVLNELVSSFSLENVKFLEHKLRFTSDGKLIKLDLSSPDHIYGHLENVIVKQMLDYYLQSSEIQFIIFLISIDEGTSGHANSVVADKRLRRIYVFEPHSSEPNQRVVETLHKFIGEDWIINVQEETHKIPIQRTDSACVVWSMYLALLYVLNPYVPPEQQRRYLSSTGYAGTIFRLKLFLFKIYNDIVPYKNFNYVKANIRENNIFLGATALMSLSKYFDSLVEEMETYILQNRFHKNFWEGLKNHSWTSFRIPDFPKKTVGFQHRVEYQKYFHPFFVDDCMRDKRCSLPGCEKCGEEYCYNPELTECLVEKAVETKYGNRDVCADKMKDGKCPSRLCRKCGDICYTPGLSVCVDDYNMQSKFTAEKRKIGEFLKSKVKKQTFSVEI